jgi:DNA-binding MarR family transcriptional regulator
MRARFAFHETRNELDFRCFVSFSRFLNPEIDYIPEQPVSLRISVQKDKQIVLKPQDFVVALKLVVTKRDLKLTELAEELGMSVSAVHGSITRAEVARLISRSAGSMRAIRPSVREFAIFGARYVFPGVLGPSTRGIPTAIGAPVLTQHFAQSDALVPVWPSAEGKVWGFELVPLHPSVPSAALRDGELYDLLALIDAIRVGAARERELAIEELKGRL